MANSTHAEFILESREHLQVFEKAMLALENASGSQVARGIDASFRAVHSLKGNAGFLGFVAIQRLAHATEAVLERYRTSENGPPVPVVELLLQAMDRLSFMIEDLEHSHSHESESLLAQLRSMDWTQPFSQSFVIRTPLATSPTPVQNWISSLCALGPLRDFQLTTFDFTQPVSEWREAICIECELKTSRSILDVKRSLGASVSFASLGCTELSEMVSVLNAAILHSEGELHYEPEDFAVGIPMPPIVWVPKEKMAKRQLPVPMLLPLADSSEQLPSTSSLDRSVAIPESAIGFRPNSLDAATSKDVIMAPPVTAPETESRSPQPSSAVVASDRITSLRIQVDLLDRLINLVGELTLIRNQSLLAFGDTEGNPRAIIQRLDSVTSELQGAVLKTRMQPVGNLFGRFPRMVRDLGRQLGKQIELVVEGQEVELDKTVLEQLSDPLTHLIRNSADHGLESPDVRQKTGKSAAGKITLSATAADGQVIIEIKDDGRGIDPQAIRSKLISLGLKTESELQRISNRELISYILLPGFSTAKQVSDVSGRGVGMDVVKTNIERLEGTLTLESTPGLGTTITMRVPLTLAIVPCLIVIVEDQRFVVPQRGLEEIVCLYPGGRSAIEHAFDTELLRLRDMLLPVVRFNEVLRQNVGFNAATKSDIMSRNAPANRDPSRIEYVLVLRANGRKYGLLVDDVRGTEEVVVKPMHPSVKKIGIFAGATLMGDGRVALIANVEGIANHADCYGIEIQKQHDGTIRDPAEVHRILLFEYGPEEQFALPLVQIRRIESIALDRIQRVGQQEFISIDGMSTRIVRLDQFLDVSACVETANMHLLLPKFVEEPMGILVSRIVDTESMSIDLQEASVDDPGVLGTAIIRGKLSIFVDTQFLREKMFYKSMPQVSDRVSSAEVSRRDELPSYLASSSQPPRPATHTNTTKQHSEAPKILLVDDTPFFREVVKRYLERIGMTVTTAIDGADGLQKLEAEKFDLVVSDIEMPNMNGWEFCLQARGRGNQTPFLALTSLSKSENVAKAHQCGFDLFEEKLDHDRLVRSVRELLGLHDGGGS